MRPLDMDNQNETAQTTSFFDSFLRNLVRAFRRTPLARLTIRAGRRLRLRETLSLGDRRMVAILECDGKQFLLAASAQSISLLAPLDRPDAGLRMVQGVETRAARADR